MQRSLHANLWLSDGTRSGTGKYRTRRFRYDGPGANPADGFECNYSESRLATEKNVQSLRTGRLPAFRLRYGDTRRECPRSTVKEG